MLRFHQPKIFKKWHTKLPIKIKQKFEEKLKLFLTNSFDRTLNNHPLHGEYDGCNSINVTGDYRAIYFMDGDIAVFIRIGTHSELFGK